MVFKRTEDRHRYFFVQHESPLPVFQRGEKAYTRLKAASLFKETPAGNLTRKTPEAIYDLILTHLLSIA